MKMERYQNELEYAIKAAVQAGEVLKKEKLAEVDAADGRDIKLVMDRKSEAVIMECLEETGIPVLSEECGFRGGSEENLKKGKLWIIDPLDGSANYWKGMRELACVSVALWENGKPVLGVVNRFYCDELFSGVAGAGAWLNGSQIMVSGVEQPSGGVLASGFPLKRSYEGADLERFIKWTQNFKKIRMLGAAALMGTFVACGRVDAYMEESIMLWDIAAAAAIVLGAEGALELELREAFQCVCGMYASEALRTRAAEMAGTAVQEESVSGKLC